MSRNSRRVVLKDILRTYDARGYIPQSPPTAFGLVRELNDILGDKQNTARAANAAAKTVAVYDRALREHGHKGPLACGKGCNYCCHTTVGATIPEIFLMARKLRGAWNASDGAFKNKFTAAEALTRTADLDQRFDQKISCPLLEESGCSSYEPRPLACRAHVSLSLQACVEAFNNISDRIPYPPVNQQARTVVSAALRAALELNGYDAGSYEMGHALYIALSDSASEAKWLAGEPIFEGVRRESQSPEAAKFSAMIRSVLIAGALGREMPPNPIFEWPTS